MTNTTIPVLDLSPEIDALWDDLNAAIQGVLKSGQFIMGPEVKKLEDEVASYLGVKHAVGVNSGTDALVIALRALGIGAGDEVITPPFSFFATAESISITGAKPVFVDIDPRTFNLSPGAIEAAVTERTRAIMPVHLFGRSADMSAIMHIAEKHNLRVVEDCAQAFGARYVTGSAAANGFEGKPVGTIGDMGAFSFFPSKNLGAYGDAGLIATDNDAAAETSAMLRTHGAKKKYHNEILGYNSRLDSIQAAILRVKLPYIDEWNAGRRSAAIRYEELLQDVPGIVPPVIGAGDVFHQYTIRIAGGRRDAVRAALQARGISTMVYYPIPQDRLPVYEDRYPDFPESNHAAAEVLSLPIWPQISSEIQQAVADALRESL